MRTRIEQTTGLPYAETSPGLLALTVAIALLVGGILLVIGLRGRQIWMIFWSIGLIICSVLYLFWHFFF